MIKLNLFVSIIILICTQGRKHCSFTIFRKYNITRLWKFFVFTRDLNIKRNKKRKKNLENTG